MEKIELPAGTSITVNTMYWIFVNLTKSGWDSFRQEVLKAKPQHACDFRFILDEVDVEISYQQLKDLLKGYSAVQSFNNESYLEQQKHSS